MKYEHSSSVFWLVDPSWFPRRGGTLHTSMPQSEPQSDTVFPKKTTVSQNWKILLGPKLKSNPVFFRNQSGLGPELVPEIAQ